MHVQVLPGGTVLLLHFLVPKSKGGTTRAVPPVRCT